MITAVKIVNYKGFYGVSRCTFEEGLNFISATNGGGKSTFLEAIVWGLGIDLNSCDEVYNRFAYGELTSMDEMTVEVEVETIFRGDRVVFHHILKIRKDINPYIIDDVFYVSINDHDGYYPDLIAKELISKQSIYEWYVNYDTIHLLSRNTIPSHYNLKRVEMIANKILKTIYFRNDIPPICITDKGKIVCDVDLSSDGDNLCLVLSVWFGILCDGGMILNKDGVIFVDDIVKNITADRASTLSVLWDKCPQIIMTGCLDLIDGFNWKMKKIVEINSESNDRFVIDECE